MSQKFYKAVKNILDMPYYKNENARSGNADYGHEAAIAERIHDAGFSQEQKESYKGLTKGLLKKWAEGRDEGKLSEELADMPEGSYILQPAGTQGFPDVLVKDYGGRLVAVEAKSGKDGTTPMWNDNVPKPDAIYALSSGKRDETTIFMGRDVINQATYDIMAQQEAEIAKVVKKYHAKLTEADEFSRGWIQKSRRQHFQEGGMTKTNYFTHPDRAKCEKNALDFAKQ
jgi:hypothetical protein